MSKAIVFGGAGFVGQHFVRKLLSLDYQVTVIDDLFTGTRDPSWPGPPKLIFIKTDCRDWFKHALVAGADLVIHLAAVVGGRVKIEGDPLAVATDLAIDADLFNWLSRVPDRPQVLYFSSSAAYPVRRQRQILVLEPLGSHYINPAPLKEWSIDLCADDIGTPDMTYGWAKLTGEFLAGFAARQYGIDVKIYRPFSGYGPGQSFDYPFPAIVRRVMQSENPVTVWGSGEQLRDFIYIDDVVDAVFATKDRLAPGEALNLGSGVGTSFRELAQRAAAVLGREIEVVADPSKPEGVFARVADVTKFRQLYSKDLTPLDTGIARVADALRAAGFCSKE